MKKLILLIAVILGALVLMCSCDCKHENISKATCTTASACADCGEEISAALGHTDGEWVTDAEATCTENGSRHQICSVCNATIRTESTDMLAHTEGEWVTDAEATCAEEGSRHQTCSVCNTTIKTEAIEKLEHTKGEWVSDTSATCTESGSKRQVCSVCNATVNTIATTKLGHDNAVFISIEETDGKFYASWSCGRCGVDYTEEYKTTTATFTTNHTYGSYPKYGLYVNATGGVRSYEYKFVVYDSNTKQVYDTIYTDSGKITYTDNDNNVVVRVYIIDQLGEIAIDVPLNDGSFGLKYGSIVYDYRFNDGTFSGGVAIE